MSVDLIVSNNSYNYPENGENPGWGEDSTAWAEAVTEVLGTLQGSNDIQLSTSNIANNVTVPQNVLNLLFNTSLVLQFRIEYTVKRIYNNGSSVMMETGIIYGYNNDTEIVMSQESDGDAEIAFDISSGQITYTTSDLNDSVSGAITFKASTMSK